MPPMSRKEYYSDKPSFYKFWMLKPGMSFGEFNKPFFDQVMR
jgi:hypothetical protein